jgi:hypothetical protein
VVFGCLWVSSEISENFGVVFLDILCFWQYRLYVFWGFAGLRRNGRGERMASKLRIQKGKQAGYLAAYFGLVLFSVSGLVLQGGISLFVGAVCWFGVVIACLLLRSIGVSAKNLKAGASKGDGYLGRAREGF